MRQSLNILNQCINQIPAGPVKTDDNKLFPPTRALMKHSMESLIHHFKLYSEGVVIPKNEIYDSYEKDRKHFTVCIGNEHKVYTFFWVLKTRLSKKFTEKNL
jgi:NADH:ubiquinone oxidoreductase subunit D